MPRGVRRVPENTAQSHVMVTYIPRENGDPVDTVWNKLPFHANQARPVSDPAMIAMARNNPWFRVEGEDAPPPPYDPSAGKPEDADQYRAYAINWIKAARNSAEVETRWAAEAELREDCDYGSEDDDLLRPFLQTRVGQLKKAESV